MREYVSTQTLVTKESVVYIYMYVVIIDNIVVEQEE